MSEYQHPSEIINLPTEGRFYGSDSPLSGGTIEVKYPTAKEEDILTSTNLIKKRIVFDEFLKSIILTKNEHGKFVDPLDLYLGDYNALLIASRVLAYGSKYRVIHQCSECLTNNDCVLDLSSFESKEIDSRINSDGTIPYEIGGVKLTLRLLTRRNEREFDKILANSTNNGLSSQLITNRHRAIIKEVNGDSSQKAITEFIDNLLVMDSRKLREDYGNMVPNLDFEYTDSCVGCGNVTRRELALGQDFFWPDS